jgi:NADPH-dependent 2,4-dienoyl-CoA reductase/sulfur reductase-like enzyme
MAAALSAWNTGAQAVAILDRDKFPGGILNQCIHSGFGLHYFGEELTGPEYAGRFERLLRGTGITLKLDATVLALETSRGEPELLISAASAAEGYIELRTRSAVLAMGCRERTRGAIAIPGARPAGIFTAGSAQRFINLEGRPVGRRAVILGSGDIGLIMARRLTLEGARVLACIEILPYPGGLSRNVVQCLDDFGIPLLLSHTITNIEGKRRVERVSAAALVDGKPAAGTEQSFECDTLLLSVGLIPENELSRKAGVILDPVTGGAAVYGNMETTVPGVFACGNVVQVHDLVDYVSAEGEKAGAAAAAFARGTRQTGAAIRVRAGRGVRYTVPQRLREGEDLTVSFRSNAVFGNCFISAVLENGETARELMHVKRSYMTPGEMQRIVLEKDTLAQTFTVDGAEIVINAEEA